jgi:2-polyprenyl-3-methyl-5-hydroxy-6-metoxy-1,4-benzoquinol methylase
MRSMTAPLQAPEGASTHYLGQSGQDYFAFQHVGGLLRGQLNARTKFARFVKPTDVVIDFGCGGATLLRSLDCARRVGVELNPVARAEASSHGVEVYETVAEVPEGIADLVVSNHALEHVLNPAAVLSALRSRLKPGGKLVLCVPIDDWRARQHRRYDPKDIDHHLYTWTPLLLGHLLSEAGYVVKDVSVLTHAWFPNWPRWIGRLPVGVFDGLCWAYAVYARERQLIAIAEPKT